MKNQTKSNSRKKLLARINNTWDSQNTSNPSEKGERGETRKV